MEAPTSPSPPQTPSSPPETQTAPWVAALPGLYLPFILLIAAAFCWNPLDGGDDFWAHASIGRWVVEHGQMPRETLFLWSAKISWIAHAWLSGVIFQFLLKVGGPQGGPFLAILLTMVCCVIPWWALWRLWRRENPVNSLMPMLFVMAIWASSARFHPRPELFTSVFLLFLFLFVHHWPQRERFPWLQAAGILVMFAIWPNLHGAVAYGLVALWLATLCDVVQYRGRALPLVLLSALAPVMVILGNPRGLEYWKVLVPVNSAAFAHIQEWKPFWVQPALAPVWVAVLEILLWVLAFALFARSKDKRWTHLAWLLFFGAAFLRARRNLWLTAFTSLFAIVLYSRGLTTEKAFRRWREFSGGMTGEPVTGSIPGPMRTIMRLGTMAFLAIGLAQAIPSDAVPLRTTSGKLPVRMSEFVLNNTRGRIFNDYEYSAYYQWYFHERRELYIDLNNAYPDALLEEYLNVLSDSPKGTRDRVFKERDIQVVVLRPRAKDSVDKAMRNMAAQLNKDRRWFRAYNDKDGTVWVRRGANSAASTPAEKP